MLPLAQFTAREHRTIREGERGQTACALQHRAQRLAATDGISAREAHFATQDDGLLLAPLGKFFDRERIERLQRDIRSRIATAHRREIDLKQFARALCTGALETGQLRLGAIGRIVQLSARAQQVADAHAGFERILTRCLDAPADAHDLGWRLQPRLPPELREQRVQHLAAAGGRIEHDHAVAGRELHIGIAARRAQRSTEVRREHHETPVLRHLATDQHIAEIGVGLEFIDRRDQLREPQPLPPRDRARTEHMTLEHHAGVQRRTHAPDTDAVAVAEFLVAALIGIERQVERDQTLVVTATHHRHAALVSLGRETARQRDQCRERRIAA